MKNMVFTNKQVCGIINKKNKREWVGFFGARNSRIGKER